jgi:hypothetical protein
MRQTAYLLLQSAAGLETFSLREILGMSGALTPKLTTEIMIGSLAVCSARNINFPAVTVAEASAKTETWRAPRNTTY